ncbi:MAG: helix-turn-helix domain-containing protein [Chloroflexota bacterium]|nr:helix-turn-helix domain-containing protein [Chloroflexota bacterium]
MSGAGDMLRLARESRAVALDAAAAETRIRIEYLAALEAGNFAELPGDVYTRGFLRNYAVYLGIDPAAVIAAYEGRNDSARKRVIPTRAAASAAPPARRPAPIRIQPLSPTPVNTRVRYGPNIRLLGLLAVVVLLVAVLATNLISGVQRLGLSGTPTLVARTTLTQTAGLPTGVAVATVGRTLAPTLGLSSLPTQVADGSGGLPTVPPLFTPSKSTPTAVSSLIGLPTPTVPPTPLFPALFSTPTSAIIASPGTGVNVQLSVVSQTQGAWVRVSVDSPNGTATTFQGVLAAGSSQGWQGKNTIRVRFARGDITTINVNGVDKGRASDSSQTVITKEWDAAGNERIVP